MSSITAFTPTPATKRNSTKLRELLALPAGNVVVAPGVYDGVSARMALKSGATILYATGAGMTAGRLGLADLAFSTQDDFVAQAGMIASLNPSTPVIADADAGFGGPAQIARTVTRYERAGLAGFHIEDQVLAKRCGHLLGKELVSTDDFFIRIRAAAISRKAIPGCDIVIIARTDAIQSLGLDEAIARLKAAVSVGADVAFLEGVRSREDVIKTVKALAPTPLLLNVVEGSIATPTFTVQDAREMGVRLVIFPVSGVFAAAAALGQTYTAILEQGHSNTGNKVPKVIEGPKEFFTLMGLEDATAIDEAAGGSAYAGGV